MTIGGKICTGTLSMALAMCVSAFAQMNPGTSTQNGTTTTHQQGDVQTQQQEQREARQATTQSSKAADHAFLKKAAEGNLAEVELGKLAQEKASSQDVKQFGQRMVDDHTKANDELKKVAVQEGVTVPEKVSRTQQAEKDRLAKLSGEQFDAAYMKHMVREHKKDVAEFRHEAQSASSPNVKNFASSTLPTLESHLKEAQQIAPKYTQKTTGGE